MRRAALSTLALALLCSCAKDAPPAELQPNPAPAPLTGLAASPRPDAPPAAKNPPYLERRSMIMFPSSLDGLQLSGQQELLKPENGVCVKYGQERPDAISLDVFVYEANAKDLKDGIGGAEVKQAFNLALSEIASLGAKGLYKSLAFGFRRKLELPTADASRKLEALAAKASFQLEGAGAMDSYLLLSAYNGCLLKLRLSMPGADASDKRFENVAKALAALVYKSGRTNVDPDAKEAALDAVKALEESPLTAGTLAAPAIMVFAKDSEDVAVSLNPGSLPWLDARELLPHNELLVAAFIGGNVRRQLLDAKLEDSPLDGLRCVFKTYSKIRESDPSLRSPTIERLMRLDAEGKLQDALKATPAALPRKVPSK